MHGITSGRLTWGFGLLLVALAAVVAAGCASGSAHTAGPSSTSTEQPTSTTTEPPSGPRVQAHGAFLLGVGGGAPDYTADVYLVNAAGGAAPRLVARRVDGKPSWFPDGTRVLASAIPPRPAQPVDDVFSYRVSGGEPLNLTHTNPVDETGAQLSPDGTRVAYTVDSGSAYESNAISVAPATGGRSRDVASIDPIIGSFAWSPDSRRLAITDINGTDTEQVWAIPASGGRERALGTGPADIVDEWGPGGRLLYELTCSGEAGCVDPYAATYLWTGTKNEKIGFVDDAQFLPDGTVAFLDGRRIGLLKPDNTLRMVGPLPERATSAAWSTDGRYLAFAAGKGGHLYVARADGGGARRLPLNLGRTPTDLRVRLAAP